MNRIEREKRLRGRGFVPELIFAWKVRRRGDLGRLLSAVLIASVGFAGAAMVLHVQDGERSREVGHRESARVVVLRPDDATSRELLDWAREASPFPDRWNPQETTGLAQAMGGINDELHAASRYSPKLRPSQKEAPVHEEQTVVIIRGAVLPSPRKYLEEKTYAESPSQVRVEARPGEELAARWRPLQESWSGLEFYKLLGKEAKFVVGIDEQGAVVFCLPSDGLDPLLDQQFQSWLRRHTLKPAEEGGVQWGQVTVRVQAANAQSGPAEEPPPEGNTKEERDD